VTSYWDNVLRRRISRRRALAATGAFAGGAALLAACSGSDNKSGEDGSVSGLVTQPQDTSNDAIRGGTLRTQLTTDPSTFDVHLFLIGAQGFVWGVGSLLFTLEPGHLESPSLRVKGDIAESFELSPDRLTLTAKIHPQAKWSPSSPFLAPHMPASVFDRKIDSEDVMASWDRFLQLGPGALEVANSKNANAPVSSVSTPDAETVTFKLSQPDSTLLPTMAVSNVGYFYLIPKEGRNDAIPFNRVMIGSGPFVIHEYTPSAGFVFQRNPNLELRDPQKRPYLDRVEAPFISDPAQGQAQFRAGNIYGNPDGANPPGVTANDVLPIKGDIPDLLMYQNFGSDPHKITFGLQQNSPYIDKRVRQAMSYAWDRDLYIDTVYNVPEFESQGIPMEHRWSSGSLAADLNGYPGGTYAPYWLDPKGDDFGPNAKFLQYNPQEAKALLRAATGSDSLNTEAWWAVTNSFGPTTGNAIEILTAMIAESGFNAQIKNLTQPEWFDRVQGKYSEHGNAFVVTVDSGGPDPANYLFQHYHKAGTRSVHAGVDSTGWNAEGDPRVNADVERMKAEFDESRRVDIAHDLQRYLADQFYESRFPGGSNTYVLAWPAVRNGRVWIGDFPRQWANLWLDPSKRPLSSA
jgi:ABC-type transport system substrate-binding protein